MTDYKSQYGQDKFCYENYLQYIPCKGFFVEVGASDGIKFSNTYFYEKKLGWTGLCIEPRTIAFPKLVANRNCFCENIGIANEEKSDVPFLEMDGYGEGMSGIINKYHPQHQYIIEEYIKTNPDHKGSVITTIKTVPLQKLLDKYTIPHIHFLSVDTEGGELEILQTIDWNKTTVDVITVENNYENKSHFDDYLSIKGFKMVMKLSIDEIYVHESFLTSIKKVAFMSTWADNTELQNQYKSTLTKNIWKNITPTKSIDDADIIVVMDDVKNGQESIYTQKNKQIIVFPREPPEINPIKKYTSHNLEYGFTYNNINHCVPQFNFLQTTINHLLTLEYNKTKLVSCIVSSKQHTLGARRRIAFARTLMQLYPYIDIYGRGLTFGKGEIKSKMDGLVPYKYSLCMENSQHDNYFTEKFTDAIVCWTVPIYWGCPNISKYFPPGSYHCIDIEKNFTQNIEKFGMIINEPVDIKALTHARNLVFSQYNVWNMIENVMRMPVDRSEISEIYGFFGFKRIYDMVPDILKDGDNILEIGAFLGKSTSYMCDLIRKTKKRINFYVVDPWEKSTASPSPDIQTLLPNDMFKKFKENMKKRKNNIIPIRNTSKNAYDQLKHLRFKFIFVDGSHSYEDVKEDIRLYGPLVDNTGIFAGDDYQAPGVKKAVDESIPCKTIIPEEGGNIMWIK